jgi:outer membrane immunogenic protein
MSKLLRASVALVALAVAGSAGAADLPIKAPPAIAPAWSWTGCYAGANAGWIGSRSAFNLSPSGNYLNPLGGLAPPNVGGTGDFVASLAALSNSYTTDTSGFAGGVQIGCNKQMLGALVLGVEADLQWSNASTTVDASYGAFPNPGNPTFTNVAHTEHVTARMDWFSTLRARAGYAWDRFLIFGTAGLALGHIQSDTSVSFVTSAGLSNVYNGAQHVGSDSSTRLGFAVGGGLEWALTNQWSLKAEYLYLNFTGGWNYNSPLTAAAVPVAPGYSWNTSVTMREQIVRVGVNYKFGLIQ